MVNDTKETPVPIAFISLPMNNRSIAEIVDRRNKIAIKLMAKGFKVANSFFGSSVTELEPEVRSPFLLGSAIQVLAQCQVAYFTKDWKSARGCRIEHQVCEEYGIPFAEINEDEDMKK